MRLDQQQQTRRFYDLVWPHRADVLRVARFLCRDPIVAEDLTQETLLKAFRGIDKLVAGPGVKAWLLQILRNTWLDRLRAAAGRPAEMSLGELSDEPATEASADTAGSEAWGDPHAVLEAFSDQQVIDALQGLPEEIRWTLLLVDVEGLSLQEAAEVLDVPAGTIKSRSHRGRRMLREKLLPLARELRLVPGETKERSSRMEEI
jgi:RNA polymerase sigma-70 factor (ECF subfamily)